MYNEIIPELEKLLDNNISLVPKFFYAVEKPIQAIVIEDIKATNYIIADRINGLDEEHTKIVLKKLGKFHAASMVLAKKNPDLMKFYNRSMLDYDDELEPEVFDEVETGNLKYLEKLISTWPDYEEISIKIGNIKEKLYEIISKIVAPLPDRILVLNHGDLWVNNIMYKRDSQGLPIDVKFIDLQMCFYTSLGIDINFFLNTSVRLDVLKSKRNELEYLYYLSLRETLINLNYANIPSWEQVKQEIFATELYGFYAFEFILPLILLDRETSNENSFGSLFNVETRQKNRELIFGTKRMQETIKYSLKRFNDLGVLDLDKY